jgi:hypothetical protein
LSENLDDWFLVKLREVRLKLREVEDFLATPENIDPPRVVTGL